MATIRDTDLFYVQRGDTPHNWTGLELKSLVSAAAKDGKLTIGQYLTPFGQQYDGSTSLTINVDGSSTSIASKVVARDSNGSFAGNVITANSFVGDGQSLTNAGATMSVAEGTQRLVMTNVISGKMTTVASTDVLTYNATTNTLTVVDLNSTSDRSLKENISVIEDPLTVLKELRGVRFKWRDTRRFSLGVIAQEVETVLPDLVSTDSKRVKSVNYNGLIAILIESVKSQQKQIDELKEQIESLSK